VIGFGGPDTIIARRVQVANPFLFKFYGSQEAVDAAAAEELYSYSTHEDHATGAAENQVGVPLLGTPRASCWPVLLNFAVLQTTMI